MPNDSKLQINNRDTLSANPIPPLWENLCAIKEFEIISDCKIKNKYSEYYEVKLSNDPFEPIILISIFFDKNNIAELYLTKIKLSTDYLKNYKTKYSNFIQISPKPNFHSIYCYFNNPKKIDIQKTNKKDELEKLKKFFTQEVWQLSNNKSSPTLFDPETCSIKAINGKAEKTINRQAGEDEVFYNQIQLLLDLVGVTDYVYRK